MSLMFIVNDNEKIPVKCHITKVPQTFGYFDMVPWQ